MTPCTSFTHCIKAWPLPVPPDCWLQLFSFCSQGRMPRVSVFQVNGLFSLIVGFFAHGFFSEYKCWTSLPPKKNFFPISIREFSCWKFLMVGERGGENGVGQFLVRLFSFIEVLSVLYCMQKKNKKPEFSLWCNFHQLVTMVFIAQWIRWFLFKFICVESLSSGRIQQVCYTSCGRQFLILIRSGLFIPGLAKELQVLCLVF